MKMKIESIVKSKLFYEILFLAIFGVWFLPHHLIMTEWNTKIYLGWGGEWYFWAIRYVILALVYFLGHKLDLRELCIDIVFLILSYVVTCNCEAKIVYLTALFVVVAKHVDYKKIFIFSAAYMIFVMVITVAGSLLGFIPNTDWNPEITCYAFGYDYSTFLGYMLLFVTMLGLMIWDFNPQEELSAEKKRKRNIIICLAAVLTTGIQFFQMKYTDTLTTPLITVIMWFAYFVLVFGFKKIPMVIGWLGSLVPMAAMCLSWLVAKVYSPESLGDEVTALTSLMMRFDLANKAFKDHHLTWLGQKIKWVGAGTHRKHPNWKYNYVDNFFDKNLLSYGIVFMVVLMVAFGIVIYKAYKKQNVGMFVSLIMLMAFGMLNAEVIDMRFHPMVLLVGLAWSFEGEKFKVGRRKKKTL